MKMPKNSLNNTLPYLTVINILILTTIFLAETSFSRDLKILRNCKVSKDDQSRYGFEPVNNGVKQVCSVLESIIKLNKGSETTIAEQVETKKIDPFKYPLNNNYCTKRRSYCKEHNSVIAGSMMDISALKLYNYMNIAIKRMSKLSDAMKSINGNWISDYTAKAQSILKYRDRSDLSCQIGALKWLKMNK